MDRVPSPEMKPDAAEKLVTADGASDTASIATHTFVADLSLTFEDGRRLLDYFISQGAAEAASELAAQLALHAHGAGPPADRWHPEVKPPIRRNARRPRPIPGFRRMRHNHTTTTDLAAPEWRSSHDFAFE